MNWPFEDADDQFIGQLNTMNKMIENVFQSHSVKWQSNKKIDKSAYIDDKIHTLTHQATRLGVPSVEIWLPMSIRELL